MTLNEIRSKYLDYFKSEGHTLIPSSSLIPENDPTTLFTSSGMQPLMPFLLGEKHPMGVRLTNSQKCFRTEDIDEVGDNRHTTFFEMLGNWSLGDYFKEEQLAWFYDFLTKEIGLEPDRLYVTVFEGDPQNGIPKDTESVLIWEKLFKKDKVDMKDRILYYGVDKNWWSRSGNPENMPAGEPGGPDSEVFYDFKTPHNPKYGKECHPNCDCGRFMEIGNSVFMQYVKQENGSFKELPQKNIDFGGGLERIAAASNDNGDIFLIDAFAPIIKEIVGLSAKEYADKKYQESFRVIADHLRGAVFIIADGVEPSNTEQGYIVRRLLRRAIRHMDLLGCNQNTIHNLVGKVVEKYRGQYESLEGDALSKVETIIRKEEEKFRKTLTVGLKQFEKIPASGVVSGAQASTLFTTYGFPFELTQEEAKKRGLTVDEEGFRKEMEKHKELSRVGAEQKFKGGLADNSEKTTMLHTATHLMLAGLRKYLGDGVHQAGSNITEERTRLDFTHDSKVDRETLDKVENYVNAAIKAEAEVVIETMPKEDAKKSGVEGSFWEKYPEVVNVYTVKGSDGTVYSAELCGGPHVANTKKIKGVFKIGKEKASSAGVRRVKATLE